MLSLPLILALSAAVIPNWWAWVGNGVGVNGLSWRPSALECLKVSINFLHWNPTPVLEFIMYVT